MGFWFFWHTLLFMIPQPWPWGGMGGDGDGGDGDGGKGEWMGGAFLECGTRDTSKSTRPSCDFATDPLRSFWNYYKRSFETSQNQHGHFGSITTHPFRPLKINTVTLELLQHTPSDSPKSLGSFWSYCSITLYSARQLHGHFGTITTDLFRPPKKQQSP